MRPVRTCGRGRISGLLAAVCVCAVAGAQDAKVEARLSEGRYLQFLAVGVRDLSIGDAQQKLAVAFAAGRPLKACLLELNAVGHLATGIPLPLPLPEVEGHKGMVGEPVAVLFHPKLPVLYLWRRRGAEAAKVDAFAHLVVFDISDVKSLRVAATSCIGESYQSEVLPSALALDPRARRLFLPNLLLRKDAKTFGPALGYLALDAQGLPVVKPNAQSAATLVEAGESRLYASGMGMVALGENILLTGGWRGVLYWDTRNRLAAMNGLNFSGLPRDEIYSIADDRRIYAAAPGTGALRSIRHVDGYPSLLPEAHQLPNAVFKAKPVLLKGKAPALAIAGDGKIHFAGLTTEGSFSKSDVDLTVAWLPQGVPPAYSVRFDRLYIPVEGWP